MLSDASTISTRPSSSSFGNSQDWSSYEESEIDWLDQSGSSTSLDSLPNLPAPANLTFLPSSTSLTARPCQRRAINASSSSERSSISSRIDTQINTTSFFDYRRLPPRLGRAIPIGRPSLQSSSEEVRRRPISPTDSERNLKYIGRDEGVIGTWFNRTTEPVNLGIVTTPRKEGLEMEAYFSAPTVFTGDHVRPSSDSGLRRNSTAQPVKSRFSWFGSKSRLPAPTPMSEEIEDPLLNLNIESALFPTGPVDRLAPSSFNDLLINAEALIIRLHTAYKIKAEALRQMEGEKSAQQEEAEEAQIRSRHLKIQLDDMANRAAEQVKAMRAFTDDLALEKLRRVEAQADKRSIRSTHSSGSGQHGSGSSGSSNSQGDSGSESENEHGPDTACTTPGRQEHTCELPIPTTKTKLKSSSPASPANPYRWLSGYLNEQREDWMRERSFAHGEFKGASQNAVRIVVNSLRSENRRLQSRVEELERTVEGCIDLVSGLRI